MDRVDPWIGPRGSAAGRLLEILRDHGPMTRPQAARLTGMSVGGIRPLVSRLVEDGHLEERAAAGRRAGPGRPGTLLVPVVPDGVVLGVDFGHAHVAVALADLSGRQLGEQRVGVDVDRYATEALDAAGDLAAAVLGAAGRVAGEVTRVVVGVPGPVDRTGRLRSHTIVASWSDLPVVAEIAGRLGVPPAAVQVCNDAHLGAVGEHRYGAARGCDHLVYVKASHGLGAGLVLGGALHRGANGVTGELGHTIVEPDGALCRCGARGCLETVVSVARVHEQIAFVRGSDDIDLRAAVAEHPAARRVVVEAGRSLGRALADLCTLLDPAMIVLGGELADAETGQALHEGVAESVRRFAQPAVADVPIVCSELGERAEVVGAMTLAADEARRAAWAAG